MNGEIVGLEIASSASFSKSLQRIAEENGADLVGITSAEPFLDIRQVIEDRKQQGFAGSMQFTYRNPERSTDVSNSLEGAKSLVVCCVSYAHNMTPLKVKPHSRVAQYATSKARETLHESLVSVSETLKRSGFKARILTDDNGLVDRAAAMRAGLGFYGKNSLIITKEWGSTVLIGSVVTNAKLKTSSNVALEDAIDGCGKCEACVPACPTGAIVGPGVIDASKCLSWIAQAPDEISEEHKIAMGNRIYGCDECQDSCPHNKIQQRRTIEDPKFQRDLDLKELLSCSNEALMEIAGDWYVYKRDPRFIRRNALINAGNILYGQSELWELVKVWSENEDVMLSNYALWALSQRKEKLNRIR